MTYIYETYIKNDNGRWHFVGWYEMLNDEFCIETKEKGKYIIKTYKWLTGNTETYRYNSITKIDKDHLYEHN